MKIIEKGKKFDKVGENMHLHFAVGEDNEPAYNSVGKVNAAINIKSFALRNILSGTDRKNQGKLPTLVGALTLEAQPIASGVGG